MNYAGENRPGWEAARLRQVHNRKRTPNWFVIGCTVALVAVVLAAFGGCEAYMNTTRDVVVKINKTGQTCTSGKSCTNLVYTSGGTFKNSDSLLAGKFNSSDVTGALCPGGVYKLKVRGYRQGFLNMWPNILKVEAVVTPPPANTGCSN